MNWLGHALNRPEQLPSLAISNGTTSGLWAPTLRYHKGTFWVVTTMVHNLLDAFDPARWDNVSYSLGYRDVGHWAECALGLLDYIQNEKPT